MKNYSFALSLISVLITSIFIFSCSNAEQKNTLANEQKIETSKTELIEQQNASTSQLPQIKSDKIEVKTFEVKNKDNKIQGWGYDIYVDSKRMIHQPIVPAMQGNSPFKTEELALKVGLFAAEKLKHTGTLPSITAHDIDSIGVNK